MLWPYWKMSLVLEQGQTSVSGIRLKDVEMERMRMERRTVLTRLLYQLEGQVALAEELGGIAILTPLKKCYQDAQRQLETGVTCATELNCLAIRLTDLTAHPQAAESDVLRRIATSYQWLALQR